MLWFTKMRLLACPTMFQIDTTIWQSLTHSLTHSHLHTSHTPLHTPTPQSWPPHHGPRGHDAFDEPLARQLAQHAASQRPVHLVALRHHRRGDLRGRLGKRMSMWDTPDRHDGHAWARARHKRLPAATCARPHAAHGRPAIPGGCRPSLSALSVISLPHPVAAVSPPLTRRDLGSSCTIFWYVDRSNNTCGGMEGRH